MKIMLIFSCIAGIGVFVLIFVSLNRKRKTEVAQKLEESSKAAKATEKWIARGRVQTGDWNAKPGAIPLNDLKRPRLQRRGSRRQRSRRDSETET